MLTRLNVASIYVLDKDEALDFYVNKLGLEKGNDVKQGDYRWLTVRVPGEAGTEVSLEQPGRRCTTRRPRSSSASSSPRAPSAASSFITDDARALYDTLKERGVDGLHAGAHRPLLRHRHGAS